MALRTRPALHALDLDRYFGDLIQRLSGSTMGETSRAGEDGADTSVAWIPRIDVLSRDDDLVIRAELPGLDPKRDVDISVQNGTLVIRGERKREERKGDDKYFRMEAFYGSFLRTVPLPDGVDPSEIRATYENGILEIVVPKANEPAQGKKVPITVGSSSKELTGNSGAKTSTSKRKTSNRSREGARTDEK